MSEFELEFVFGKIVSTTKKGFQKVTYGIKWKNYGVQDATYEPSTNIKGTHHIEEYEFL